MIKGELIAIDSGIYLGLLTCIALLVFIFMTRAFDRSLRKKFICTTGLVMVAIVCSAVQTELAHNNDFGAAYTFTLLIKNIAAALMLLWVVNISCSDITRQKNRELLIMAFMAVVLVVAIILEVTHVFANIVFPTASIVLLFFYMYMYADRYNVDSVSKCFKRRCFYADSTKYSRSHIAVISMDLNNLKFINDNFGHKAGDIALLTFAEVCRAVKPSKFILYRTGGDEFMMLGIKATYEEAETLVKNIRHRLEETAYTCSFGIHMYAPGDDFDAVVVKADAAMYEDKRTFKEFMAKHGTADEQYERINSFTNNINFLD
ncbi:MAG: GGDEF domain-containing protein [Pseudobutyrivibrio sp.]|nr:GGDEF domain-containing protein [Pseudobutyrivibrio sp.]